MRKYNNFIALIIFLTTSTCMTAHATENTYLGELKWKTSTTIQLNEWNEERTGFATQIAPEGKVFLVCFFPETAKSDKNVSYDDKDFYLELEGDSKKMRTYAVTAGINAASVEPAFTVDVMVAEYHQKKGAPFAVVFLAPVDATMGSLTVRDVKNNLVWETLS